MGHETKGMLTSITAMLILIILRFTLENSPVKVKPTTVLSSKKQRQLYVENAVILKRGRRRLSNSRKGTVFEQALTFASPQYTV